MTEHYDVVIIGSGAGGGTMTHALAASGKRILLLERGDFPGAIAECSNAIESEPRVAGLWLNRGLARRMTGQLEGDGIGFEQCGQRLRRFPKRRPALIHRDRIQPRLKRPRKLILPPLQPHGQEHLLEQFLALVGVADHAGQKTHERPGVPADERLQRRALAERHPGHQPLVAVRVSLHGAALFCVPSTYMRAAFERAKANRAPLRVAAKRILLALAVGPD